MNRGRTNFSMPSEHNYRITPYWLLGFVEGDGSFFIRRKNYQLYFSIVQHSRDYELMNKIGDFLYDLPFINKQTMRKSSIRISESSVPAVLPCSPNGGNGYKNPVTYLIIDHTYLIKFVIIPFFSSMTWRSKKFLDFEDFSLVFKLKEQGHHYTHKGKILIDSFIGQMNNNRLSTLGGLPREDREFLISQAKIILQAPSNYKKEKGKTFIISENKWLTVRKGVFYEIADLNGNVVITCNSITAVMDFLEVSRYIVLKRLEDGEPVLWVKEDRLVTIQELER